MDVNKLRQLIRTGEYLEGNLSDDSVRSKWVFDVEDFVSKLDREIKKRIEAQIYFLKGSSTPRLIHGNFMTVIGFLRSLYDNDNSANKLTACDSQTVFIVHGHDDSLIESVKSCVVSLNLNPIVLREQPDEGKTIIEKLEEWLCNCKCAIILYTPCDVGKAVNANVEEKRARQNVVYEHGLFQGYLGRKRIIVLKKGDTALPGDCSGIVYISPNNEGWQEQIKKNIDSINQSL